MCMQAYDDAEEKYQNVEFVNTVVEIVRLSIFLGTGNIYFREIFYGNTVCAW